MFYSRSCELFVFLPATPEEHNPRVIIWLLEPLNHPHSAERIRTQYHLLSKNKNTVFEVSLGNVLILQLLLLLIDKHLTAFSKVVNCTPTDVATIDYFYYFYVFVW